MSRYGGWLKQAEVEGRILHAGRLEWVGKLYITNIDDALAMHAFFSLRNREKFFWERYVSILRNHVMGG